MNPQPSSIGAALAANFLGNSPAWYKRTIVTLAMALRCYPLQPGGLLALEAGGLLAVAHLV